MLNEDQRPSAGARSCAASSTASRAPASTPPRSRRDGTRRRSSASTTSAAASPPEPLAATRGEDGRWIGGSVRQWADELTAAVLEYHAAGFIYRSPDDTPEAEALANLTA